MRGNRIWQLEKEGSFAKTSAYGARRPQVSYRCSAVAYEGGVR